MEVERVVAHLKRQAKPVYVEAVTAEEDGYGDVEHGSSFVMAAQFVDGKCPVETGTFVTYGQSENQRSRHAADYTRAFSRKRWNRVPFCRGEVRRKTLSTKRVVIRRR